MQNIIEAGIISLVLALSLQNLHHNLLLFNQESSHYLLPDSLVAQDSTIGTVDGLLASGEASFLLISGRLDTLQLESCHGTFRQTWALLQVLEDQLSSWSSHGLPLVGLGVVRQPSPVSDTLDHLGFSCRSESSNIS